MNNFLVTGASGFIGRGLCQHLSKKDYQIMAAVRKITPQCKPLDYKLAAIGDINSTTSWENELAGIDCVIHLAAFVHVMKDDSNQLRKLFFEVNTSGTLNLARQAARSGVKRFIYLSSIKVNGEKTENKNVFTELDTPDPHGDYAKSKFEAEKGLNELRRTVPMEIVIIRPPLVYGPGVKANFRSMMRWAESGFPLPLGSINNKRSLVSLDNLIDFITVCVEHPAAANQTFLVSDGRDLSTTELLLLTAKAMKSTHRIFRFPRKLLVIFLTLIGKKAMIERLFDSLSVDIGKSRNLLGWSPPYSVEEEIKKTVDDFLGQI